jgi:uncharacterized protein YeaO (DUF488 family)
MQMDIQIRRAYDPPRRGDGYRVLVDRVWPRGVSKQETALDEWRKDQAVALRAYLRARAAGRQPRVP